MIFTIWCRFQHLQVNRTDEMSKVTSCVENELFINHYLGVISDTYCGSIVEAYLHKIIATSKTTSSNKLTIHFR